MTKYLRSALTAAVIVGLSTPLLAQQPNDNAEAKAKPGNSAKAEKGNAPDQTDGPDSGKTPSAREAATDNKAENTEDDDSEPRQVVIEFSSKIQDRKGRPVSGVFPLEFRLHPSASSEEPIWREKHYVAVNDGTYKISLGVRKKLYESMLENGKWISVHLGDEGRILRDRLVMSDNFGPAPPDNKRPVKAAKTKTPEQPAATKKTVLKLSDEAKKLLKKAGGDSNDITHANIADRALEADHAKVAEKAKRLKNFSAEQLKKMAEKGLERIAKHVSDPKAHQATGGIHLGDDEYVPDESAGGTGGAPYNITCPEDHVVTGIRGGSGKYVDRVSIICKPVK